MPGTPWLGLIRPKGLTQRMYTNSNHTEPLRRHICLGILPRSRPHLSAWRPGWLASGAVEGGQAVRVARRRGPGAWDIIVLVVTCRLDTHNTFTLQIHND